MTTRKLLWATVPTFVVGSIAGAIYGFVALVVTMPLGAMWGWHVAIWEMREGNDE